MESIARSNFGQVKLSRINRVVPMRGFTNIVKLHEEEVPIDLYVISRSISFNRKTESELKNYCRLLSDEQPYKPHKNCLTVPPANVPRDVGMLVVVEAKELNVHRFASTAEVRRSPMYQKTLKIGQNWKMVQLISDDEAVEELLDEGADNDFEQVQFLQLTSPKDAKVQ
ncbi:hypothetical protein AVEN_92559-1 [Araneus ventricosus]|uniref:Uncharacterized protein n=1 Tax=Araneus ventricosus TaxID=182803 RepID=A0A4Y2AJL1_ARAVE|nr:hypothetical protein AVEN_92559-1 [Araneus ventricosus]